MRKSLLTGLIFLAMIFGSSLTATAFDYTTIGDNITIYDGNSDSSVWHGSSEDQEVEAPNATGNQSWDMEAFFWNKTSQTLTMIGGYDLIDGQGSTTPGHIFINVGNDNNWDYAISFNENNIATWYQLDSNSNLSHTTYFSPGSDPFQFDSGAVTSGTLTSTYFDFFSDDLTNVATGGAHNAITLDLSGLLTAGTSFTTHFTMTCGNDNLMGRSNAVPIPGAFWLLGSGLFGLIGIRRRQ